MKREADSQGIFTWTEGRGKKYFLEERLPAREYLYGQREKTGNISGKSEKEEISRVSKFSWKEKGREILM